MWRAEGRPLPVLSPLPSATAASSRVPLEISCAQLPSEEAGVGILRAEVGVAGFDPVGGGGSWGKVCRGGREGREVGAPRATRWGRRRLRRQGRGARSGDTEAVAGATGERRRETRGRPTSQGEECSTAKKLR